MALLHHVQAQLHAWHPRRRQRALAALRKVVEALPPDDSPLPHNLLRTITRRQVESSGALIDRWHAAALNALFAQLAGRCLRLRAPPPPPPPRTNHRDDWWTTTTTQLTRYMMRLGRQQTHAQAVVSELRQLLRHATGGTAEAQQRWCSTATLDDVAAAVAHRPRPSRRGAHAPLHRQVSPLVRATAYVNHMLASGHVFPLCRGRALTPQHVRAAAPRVVRPPTLMTPREVATDDEIHRLLHEGCRTTQERLMVLLLVQTGIRCSTLCQLTRAAVWDAGRATRVLHATEVKNATRHRVLTMGPELRQCVTAWVTTSLDDDDGLLFPGLRRAGVRRVLQRCAARAHVPYEVVRPHALRRYTVTCLLAHGNSLEHVARWLGHAKVSTTFRHYWVPTPEHLCQSMRIPWQKPGALCCNQK